ncbi:hypothetical protein M0805_004834 [Coniferiporia weirii]|nr:hypothetical protein M0805_004834 [Coniferiporia weirii]
MSVDHTLAEKDAKVAEQQREQDDLPEQQRKLGELEEQQRKREEGQQRREELLLQQEAKIAEYYRAREAELVEKYKRKEYELCRRVEELERHNQELAEQHHRRDVGELAETQCWKEDELFQKGRELWAKEEELWAKEEVIERQRRELQQRDELARRDEEEKRRLEEERARKEREGLEQQLREEYERKRAEHEQKRAEYEQKCVEEQHRREETLTWWQARREVAEAQQKSNVGLAELHRVVDAGLAEQQRKEELRLQEEAKVSEQKRVREAELEEQQRRREYELHRKMGELERHKQELAEQQRQQAAAELAEQQRRKEEEEFAEIQRRKEEEINRQRWLLKQREEKLLRQRKEEELRAKEEELERQRRELEQREKLARREEEEKRRREEEWMRKEREAAERQQREEYERKCAEERMVKDREMELQKERERQKQGGKEKRERETREKEAKESELREAQARAAAAEEEIRAREAAEAYIWARAREAAEEEMREREAAEEEMRAREVAENEIERTVEEEGFRVHLEDDEFRRSGQTPPPTHSSPLSEAEWHRRQEEQARKQQGQLKWDFARSSYDSAAFGIFPADPPRESRDATLTIGDDSETGLSTELIALLTSAVHDEHPLYSLSTIRYAVANSGSSQMLDALHVVPLLLDSADPAAGEILAQLGECGNAKETVIAVQESLERILHTLSGNDELEDEKIFLRLERFLLLYVGAIPRLKLRKKSASETLKPLFADLPSIIEKASPSFSRAEGENAIQLILKLLSCVITWSRNQGNKTDLIAVQVLCKNTLYSALADLSHFIDKKLAQRKFVLCFPRLVFGKEESVNTRNDLLLRECVDTAEEMSCTLENLVCERSTGALILFAFLLSSSPPSAPPTNTMLSSLSPILIASLQSSAGVDASLFILLSGLFPSISSPNSPVDLDPDLLPPLIYAVSPLACTSSDPQIRLIAFRTLGALLSRAPPLEHMGLLRELLTDSTFPALRVAAVGLLKDAVLSALASSGSSTSTHTTTSPFASPALLHTFGYVVLRPDPPDLFSKPADRASLEAFLDTQEPKRLIECLAFYYVLLMRDTTNLTGVRDSGQIKSVEKEFLGPLRTSLHTWTELEDALADDHAMMPLAALETSLERIDDAYGRLKETA